MKQVRERGQEERTRIGRVGRGGQRPATNGRDASFKGPTDPRAQGTWHTGPHLGAPAPCHKEEHLDAGHHLEINSL